MPVRPVRSAAKRARVFLAMTYSTPNGRNRPRMSCRSDTLRPRYSVSTAISARPSLSTNPSMAESFSARARTLLFAKGDYLLSVVTKMAFDPSESKASLRVPARERSSPRQAAGGFQPLDPLRGTGGLWLWNCGEVYVSELANASVAG